MKRLRFLIIASALTLVGCSTSGTSSYVNNSEYNPFEQLTVQNGENIDSQFGYGLVHPADDLKIDYCKNMSLDFWIDNSGSRNDFGFMIFVDGIRQDISIDGGQRENMHIFDMDAGERKTFTVNFEPTVAHFNEELGICFGLMLDPKFTPESLTASFGNRYKINAFDLTMANVTTDINIAGSELKISSDAILDETEQKYIQYDENGNVSGNRLEENVQLLTKKVNNEIDDKTPNAVSSSDKLEIQMLGGPETTWRVSMYADHKLMPVFNGNFYANMQAGKNKISTYTVDMSNLELPAEDYGTIYCIASPTDGGRIIVSHAMVFNGRKEVE